MIVFVYMATHKLKYTSIIAAFTVLPMQHF